MHTAGKVLIVFTLCLMTAGIENSFSSNNNYLYYPSSNNYQPPQPVYQPAPQPNPPLITLLYPLAQQSNTQENQQCQTEQPPVILALITPLYHLYQNNYPWIQQKQPVSPPIQQPNLYQTTLSQPTAQQNNTQKSQQLPFYQPPVYQPASQPNPPLTTLSQPGPSQKHLLPLLPRDTPPSHPNAQSSTPSPKPEERNTKKRRRNTEPLNTCIPESGWVLIPTRSAILNVLPIAARPKDQDKKIQPEIAVKEEHEHTKNLAQNKAPSPTDEVAKNTVRWEAREKGAIDNDHALEESLPSKDKN